MFLINSHKVSQPNSDLKFQNRNKYNKYNNSNIIEILKNYKIIAQTVYINVIRIEIKKVITTQNIEH